jgi:hypothetical protein
VTEFPVNIARYVSETRAKGATPVLVTPLARRQFKAGKLDNDLVPWADAIRKIAAETGTPLLDLNADSAAALAGARSRAGGALAQLPPSPEGGSKAATGTTIAASAGVTPPPVPATGAASTGFDPMADPKLAFDYTHLGREGADLLCRHDYPRTAGRRSSTPAVPAFLGPAPGVDRPNGHGLHCC